MKKVFLIVRYRYPQKTIRRHFSDTVVALIFLNDITSAEWKDIIEVKMEIEP